MVWSDVYLCVFCSTAYATPTSYCSWSIHWISQNRSARRLELRKYVFRIQKIALTGLGGSVRRGHSVSQSCPALSCWPPCGLAWLIAPKYSNPGQGRRLFLFIWHHLPFSTLLCHWASCPGRLAGLASVRLGPARQWWPSRGFAGPMAAWGCWEPWPCCRGGQPAFGEPCGGKAFGLMWAPGAVERTEVGNLIVCHPRDPGPCEVAGARCRSSLVPCVWHHAGLLKTWYF